jgi:SAM-dependent methyltransferase
MSPPTNKPYTEGSSSFDPDEILSEDLNSPESVFQRCLKIDGLWPAITYLFNLPEDDEYVYHATASVTLEQVQKAIIAGNANGLHDWYFDSDGKSLGHPPQPDIDAYISLFDPSKNPTNTLKGFSSNSRKASIRKGVADHLTSKRHLSPNLSIPKRKTLFPNPYFTLWAWSCKNLEYCGPDATTCTVKASHHILPVFMHHFGCVCPSYESLQIIKKVSQGRTVLDVGCGNGYWTYMLRREGVDVIAIDNAQSRYRTCWISDIVFEDGLSHLQKKRQGSGKNDVLLLVYPIIANDFTGKILRAFKGDVICVVGTQNSNGYTCFRDQIVDEWMGRERPEMELLARVPLPSFAGKDEALFVWRRRD